MRQRTYSRRFKLTPLSTLVVWLSACAAGPLDRPDGLELANSAPLPRALCIQVQCEDHECFGEEAEWASDLVTVLRELKVASRVWHERERRQEDADMVILVTIKKAEPLPPTINTQGALLNFMAWSVVPLLPWWIPDVDTNPGVNVHIELPFVPPEHRASPRGSDPPAPEVKTSLRERYPLLSWPTLGALLLPPFLFKQGDPAHLARSIGQRVRQEVAFRVADSIKKQPLLKREILSGLVLLQEPSGWVLEYDVGPEEPGRVNVRLDGDEQLQEIIPPFEDKPDHRSLSLPDLPPTTSPGQEPLLRLEAISRKTGEIYRYTLPLTPGTLEK